VRVEAVVVVSELSPRRILAWRRRFGRSFATRALRAAGIGRAALADPERAVLVERVGAGGGRPPTIRDRCRDLGLAYHVVRGPNEPDALALLDAGRPDLVLNAGGGILRQPFLERAGRGVLNVHSGPLPHVRGMSAVEWSLYLGLVPTATVHWIDRGVDTGGILGDVATEIRDGDGIGRLRARTLLAGIDLLAGLLEPVAAGTLAARPNPRDRGRQYYEMAEPLKRVVEGWLATGRTPVATPAAVDPGDGRPAVARARP
jgi:methionyl-tRNA formyltransferase